MTGKAKIEALTNSWYGFAVFSAITAVLADGIGLWSITKAVFWLLGSWLVSFFIGRALVKKSSLVRTILILGSALFAVLGTVSVGRTAWTFLQSWEIGLLGTIAFSAISTWMNVKSFRTLTDPDVKAYFG
jgi:hypothetical protein